MVLSPVMTYAVCFVLIRSKDPLVFTMLVFIFGVCFVLWMSYTLEFVIMLSSSPKEVFQWACAQGKKRLREETTSRVT